VGKPKSKVCEVRVAGPLTAIAEEFRTNLLQSGYTPLTVVNKLRSIGYLSSWLQERGLGAAELTDERLEEYLRGRRQQGHGWEISRKALQPLLEILSRRRMLASTSSATESTDVDRLLARFSTYLREERGLVASTAVSYARDARRFLERCAPDGDLGQLSAADVPLAIRAESAGRSVVTVQSLVSVLRSFLRFCHLEGLTGADLSGAALSMTGRRHSHVPRGVVRSDVSAMVRTCDRRTASGRRDFAILTTLLSLGLRAGEVASLTLDDIDWRAAEVVVHNGKGRRDERLPLPADVGAAIAAYLRWARPQTSVRQVFLTAIAPVQRLSSSAVSAVVRRACRRAGVASIGPHRLRHALACELVSAGAPLTEIGQVLRHRGLDTTVVYARADIPQLRTLARPWPTEQAK
jgi:integrase/recombinase XerD